MFPVRESATSSKSSARAMTSSASVSASPVSPRPGTSVKLPYSRSSTARLHTPPTWDCSNCAETECQQKLAKSADSACRRCRGGRNCFRTRWRNRTTLDSVSATAVMLQLLFMFAPRRFSLSSSDQFERKRGLCCRTVKTNPLEMCHGRHQTCAPQSGHFCSSRRARGSRTIPA